LWSILERRGQHILVRLVGPSNIVLHSKEKLFAICRVQQDDNFWQHNPALRTLTADGLLYQAGCGDDVFLVPKVKHLEHLDG
jgi:hypothetical protein